MAHCVSGPVMALVSEWKCSNRNVSLRRLRRRHLKLNTSPPTSVLPLAPPRPESQARLVVQAQTVRLCRKRARKHNAARGRGSPLAVECILA